MERSARRNKDRDQQFWAFVANPQVYRIEQVVRALAEDTWTARGKAIRAGDYAVIWKAKGRDAWRGIIPFAEVLSDPLSLDESTNPFWTVPAKGAEERVRVRHMLPPALPLKYLRDDSEVSRTLGTLNVARATGGTIFRVTPAEWEAVVDLAGGLP
jgi:predicted RNA-binding protein with PUA-like domain